MPFQGLMNSLPAFAHHFCLRLILPAEFSQPRNGNFVVLGMHFNTIFYQASCLHLILAYPFLFHVRTSFKYGPKSVGYARNASPPQAKRRSPLPWPQRARTSNQSSALAPSLLSRSVALAACSTLLHGSTPPPPPEPVPRPRVCVYTRLRSAGRTVKVKAMPS